MYIDADGKLQDVYAPGDTVKVRLSGKLSVPRAQRGRVIPVIRSSIRQSRTNASPPGTQSSAGRPRSSPQGIPGGTRRYSTWFGAYTASHKSIVQEHPRLISSHNLSSFVHGSPCTTPDTYSYIRGYTFQLRDRCPVIDKSPE